ncbi:MAG: NAD(P)-binding domain-containing protein [Deltaproteobacteria bacterium]|jgi:pyrroline-5-carboxylate reductase|nr:NAD(P)-binding domain-containing protein [Deltaproteobacteria bacterium]
MQLGFIGTGAITSALVTGLCTTKSSVDSIWVSSRSETISHQLQERFPQVQIGNSNQEVVDRSDVVVLAFLPQQKEEVLKVLRFRKEQTIIHLLSGTRNTQISELLNAPCKIVRSVPLPCAANHIGPIAVYPDNQIVNKIFTPLGTVVTVDKEEQLELLSAITAFMAPYFEMVAQVIDWSVDNGVKQQQAAQYSASMFEALSLMAKESVDGNVHQLIQESQTPGGLNALAMQVIKEQGGFDFVKTALDAVKSRVMEG